MSDLQPQDKLPLFGNINAVSEEDSAKLAERARFEREALTEAVAKAPGLDEDPGQPGAWELANLLEGSAVNALRMASDPSFPVDPEFTLTPEKMKVWMEGLPKNVGYEDEFLDVGSDKHGEELAKRLRERLDFDVRLGSQGLGKNLAYRIGASMVDPTMWAAGLASAGAARYFGIFLSGSRAVRSAKAAALMGTEAIVPETLLQNTQPGRPIEDFYYTLLGGLAFGGIGGALTRKGLSKAEQEAIQRELMGKMHTLDTLEAAARGEVGPPAPVRLADVLPPEPAAVRAEGELESAAVKVVPEEPAPSLTKALTEAATEADVPLPVKLRQRATEVAEQSKFTTRLLDDATQALEAIRRVQDVVEVKRMGDGVTKVTRKKGAKEALDFEKLPPSVRVLVESIVDESGVVAPKQVRELEARVADLTKEVTQLQTKATTMNRLADLREKGKPAQAEHQSAGAAATTVDRVRQDFWEADKLKEAELHELLNAPTAAFSAVRFDLASALMGAGQKNPIFRSLAARALEEPVGFVDDRVRQFSAELRRTLGMETAQAEIAKVVEPAFLKWLNENGHGVAGRLSFDLREQFMEEVSKHQRFGSSSDPHIVKAAEAYAEQYRMWWEKANAAGVAGFDGKPVGNYVPRVPASDKVRKADTLYGTNQILKELIIPAVAKANDDLEESVVELLAKGWWERIRKLSAGVDIGDFRGMQLSDRDYVKSLLQDIHVDDDGIEYVLTALQGKRPNLESGPAHGKSRLLLDEGFEATLTHGPHSDVQGQVERVTLADLLFENNAEALFSHYVHSMSGHVALAEVGFKSKADWTRYINEGQKYADHLGIDKQSTAEAVKRLEYVWDTLTGVPVWGDPASALNVWSRRVRGVELMRVGGMLGIAQLPETGYMMAHLGVRHILAAAPEFFSIFSRNADKELASKLSRELEILTGGGTEWVRHIQVNRWDHMERGSSLDAMSARHVGRFDQALDLGKRMTMVGSLMTPVNTFLQRMTLRGIAHKLAKGRNAYSKQRLADLGLSEADADRVAAEIEKHATRESSLWFKDGKIAALNIEKWDKEVLNLFTYSTHRLARRIVMQNDLGVHARWMSHPMAKMLLFFRNFVIGAYSKMFLHNIKMADAMSAVGALGSMAAATLVYYGRIYAQSVGMDERARKDYLKRNLSADKVAVRAWQAAGWSSLLPIPLGQIEKAVGGTDSMFMRTSGQASDAIFGTPVVGHFDSALEGLAGVAKAARSPQYNFSRQDLRNVWQSFVPGQNLLPMIWAMNALGQPLPARSKN